MVEFVLLGNVYYYQKVFFKEVIRQKCEVFVDGSYVNIQPELVGLGGIKSVSAGNAFTADFSCGLINFFIKEEFT